MQAYASRHSISDAHACCHALFVQLVSRASAPNGIGARVVATVGSRQLVREVKVGSGYLSQSDTRVHLGLDRAAAVDPLRPEAFAQFVAVAVAETA